MDASPLVLFDSHQLGTTLPRGGHPPHQIQALDRTQPGLPLKPGEAGTTVGCGVPTAPQATHDDLRNGVTTLFAALNVLDGTVLGRCMQRHRHQAFLRFLNALERAVPAGKVIHVILDTYGSHKHPKVLKWLARHPRFVFHFTPTSGSWLNAVETFFSALTRRRLQRGSFHSIVDLQAAITRYIAEHNDDPKPFTWTKTPGQVLAKLNPPNAPVHYHARRHAYRTRRKLITETCHELNEVTAKRGVKDFVEAVTPIFDSAV